MLYLRLLVFSLWFVFSIRAKTEYRAFHLVITDKQGVIKEVDSYLDPLQYKDYFYVPVEAKIIYNSTWKCTGNTSHQDICPNPKLKPAPEPKI